MPYKFVWNNRRFYCVLSGAVSWDDIYATSGALYGSRYFEVSREVLIVFTESVKIIVTPDNAMELAYLDKAASAYNKLLNFAIVVAKPEAKKFALSYIKSSKQIQTPWRYQVFDKVKDAEKWFKSVSKTRPNIFWRKKKPGYHPG